MSSRFSNLPLQREKEQILILNLGNPGYGDLHFKSRDLVVGFLIGAFQCLFLRFLGSLECATQTGK